MSQEKQVPYDKCLDNSLALMNEGYLFIKNRMDKYHTDLFITRLLGQKVICMSGQQAARIFYDPQLFQRNGAAPKRVQKTLFGENAIQSMDDEAHIHRKRLFMSLVTAPEQKKLSDIVLELLKASVGKWKGSKDIILFDEANLVLCQAVCEWAGVPLNNSEIREKADLFSAMVDAFGAVGPRHWKGRTARKETEKWIQALIESVRAGKVTAAKDAALYAMAFHKELNGLPLDSHMAAVELINVLRPVVAISTYIVFAALALHEYPECRTKLLSEGDEYAEMFVQEVRRFYPFGPFLGARVRRDFNWNGCNFKMGTLVLLDIYGMNHDPKIWDNPNAFRPERFKGWNSNLFDFIPQGGGDPAISHRCPGERITVEIMKTSINFLANQITYDIPDQDFSYSLARIPALPKSGIIMSNIKVTNKHPPG
jgi:fatty-acid peroxygenase